MTKQNEKDAKRVPELRFKGFTDDWEQRKLGEIFNERKEKSENSNEQLLSVTINDGVVKSDTLDRKSNASKDKSNYKIVNPDDIAYNSMRMWQGSLGVSSYYGIVSPAYTVISVRNVGKDNPYFYKYSFKRSRSLNVFRKHSQGLTPDTWNLKYPLFKQIKYQAPSLIEQEKIGQLFQSLDKTITLHEEQHRQLEQLKKALLQKMFADETGYPALRFKGFTEKWEQRKLGETVVNIVAGGDINKAELLSKGKYPVYANALTNNGIVGYYASQYRIAAPAVTVTGRGDIGIAKARDINFTPVVRLLAISSQHNNYFLENLINTHRSFAESTGVPQLTVPQLSNYKLYFPQKINEEVFIGKLFKKMDHLTTLHQHKIDNLKRLKRALLQKMFV